MSAGFFLLAVLGGGIGATARFVVDGLVMRRVSGGFPWGTFAINVSGSLILGFLTGLAGSSLLDSPWLFVLGSGVVGGYTTFSTAMVDTVHLLQKGASRRFVANSLGMLVVTVAVAVLGLLVGRAA